MNFDEHLRSYIDLLTVRENGKIQKRVMVEGKSGTGKTALCAKMVQDWINGINGFQEFTMVLLVPLLIPTVTIGEIAKAHLSGANEVTVDQLNAYIKENPDKVLIIVDSLDGFDEKIFEEYDRQRNENIPQVDDLDIIKILRSDLLETCFVLVTSGLQKAYRIQRIPLFRSTYSFVRVEGLTDKNLPWYIQDYFKNDGSKASHLIRVIQENDVLAESMDLNYIYKSWTPSYARELCLMWEEEQEEIRRIQTFSLFFKKLFQFLKDRYVQKKSDDAVTREQLRVQIAQDFMKINKIAFEERLRNKFTLTDERFERSPEILKTALEVGVLTKEKDCISWDQSGTSTPQPNMKSNILFTHDLFQDFMAGEHLAFLFATNRNRYNSILQIVLEVSRQRELKYLLASTVVQSKEIGSAVMTALTNNVPTVTEDYHFILDITFECQHSEVNAMVKSKLNVKDRYHVKTFHHSGGTTNTVTGYIQVSGLEKVVCTQVDLV